MSSGLPRNSQPALPATSMPRAAYSLLKTASMMKSELPVLAPLSSSPVGALNMPRRAMAAGCWRYSDQKLYLAPR